MGNEKTLHLPKLLLHLCFHLFLVLILVFRCWHYKNKWTKSFEVMNEMFIFNSFCI